MAATPPANGCQTLAFQADLKTRGRLKVGEIIKVTKTTTPQVLVSEVLFTRPLLDADPVVMLGITAEHLLNPLTGKSVCPPRSITIIRICCSYSFFAKAVNINDEGVRGNKKHRCVPWCSTSLLISNYSSQAIFTVGEGGKSTHQNQTYFPQAVCTSVSKSLQQSEGLLPFRLT